MSEEYLATSSSSTSLVVSNGCLAGQRMVIQTFPTELVEAIVDELEDSSLHPFCLPATHFMRAAQARIFSSLQIRVSDGRYFPDLAPGYKPMSPWQAELLFSSSSHLASYVQCLRIDIPPPRISAEVQRDHHMDGNGKWNGDGLSSLTLPLSGSSALAHFRAFGGQTPTGTERPYPDSSVAALSQRVRFSRFRVPAALIRSAAASIPVLTLYDVIIEDADAVVPGALTAHRLAIMWGGEREKVPRILQVSAATLTRLGFCVAGKCYAVPALPLPALRVLELECSPQVAPYQFPDLFVSLMAQIPSAMPRLEQLVLRVTVSLAQDNTPPTEWRTAWWARHGPFDLGATLNAIHSQLRFHDPAPPPPLLFSAPAPASIPVPEARRELREKVYAEFVSRMGDALRDNGELSIQWNPPPFDMPSYL
ncbi:hypothetical protein K438DRAFT_1748183 [Mycena galopus ATCC 62051]|nr:hypothetical protein K438DRAFT_1748183 [Mycena galopus ATCC 62051]